MANLSKLLFQIIYLGVILALLIVVGYVVVRFVRGRMRKETADGTFTLQDLRTMRDRGELSEAEFARMRDALVAHFRRQASDGKHGVADVESDGDADPPTLDAPDRNE
ncbi:MAG: SHOCT domain-containing protein [Planctomycetes bacterium]|nr:SHOCT domain-containing protein [Planctomycetota bacterium]